MLDGANSACVRVITRFTSDLVVSFKYRITNIIDSVSTGKSIYYTILIYNINVRNLHCLFICLFM